MGENIILIHGDFQNKSIFNEIEKFLNEEGHKTHNLDLPGHGENESIKEPLNHLQDYIQENSIENPILIGHSFGGLIASTHASKDNTKKLILLNCAPLDPREIAPEEIWKQKRETLKRYQDQLFQNQENVDYNHLKELSEEELQGLGIKTTNPKAIENHFKVYENFNNNVIKEITTPTTLIISENDPLTPIDKLQDLSKEKENISLITIDSNHNSPLQNPEEIIEILKELISNHS